MFTRPLNFHEFLPVKLLGSYDEIHTHTNSDMNRDKVCVCVCVYEERTVVKVLALAYLRRTKKHDVFLTNSHWRSDEWVVMSRSLLTATVMERRASFRKREHVARSGIMIAHAY